LSKSTCSGRRQSIAHSPPLHVDSHSPTASANRAPHQRSSTRSKRSMRGPHARLPCLETGSYSRGPGPAGQVGSGSTRLEAAPPHSPLIKARVRVAPIPVNVHSLRIRTSGINMQAFFFFFFCQLPPYISKTGLSRQDRPLLATKAPLHLHRLLDIHPTPRACLSDVVVRGARSVRKAET
jgi:hypothetical protein